MPPEWEGEDIAVVGVVDDLPAVSPQGTRFALAVERVLTPRAVVPPRISLAWIGEQRFAPAADPPPAIRAGERWRMTVRLKRPHGNVNPGGFDLEAWLLQHAFRATGYVQARGSNARVDAFGGRASDYVQRTRERVRDRIERALRGAPYAGVVAALAIGDQRAIPEAQWTVFNRTGISHLVSISGLHVTVFAAFASALAFALARRSVRLTSRLPARKLAAAAGVAAACAYVLLAGAEIPAVRTLAMVAIAARGTVARAAGDRRDRLALGARGRPAVGSLGAADAGLLAVVRRGGAAPVRVGRAAARGRARRGCGRACASTCARARTRSGSSRWDWRR